MKKGDMSNAEREGSQTEPHDRPALSDLEMTRLCAEAMGYGGGTYYSVSLYARDGEGMRLFDPLNDDAQAMALVKKLRLDTEAALKDGAPWTVSGGDDTQWSGPIAVAHNADLNRAIVECVAKMQAGR